MLVPAFRNTSNLALLVTWLVAFESLTITLRIDQVLPPASNARYNFRKVQFLAFSLFTSPGGLVACKNASPPCYIGDRVTAQDLKRRVSVLSQAMIVAAAHADNNPRTLKVFAAPEFFFRGAFGAYDAMTWAQAKFDLSEALERLTSSSPFNEWLVVCGTIIAVHYGNESTSTFYNAAPIYFQGRKMIIFKKYISDIDFLDVVGAKRVRSPYIVCQDNATDHEACLYGLSQHWMLRYFGFLDYDVIVNNTFDVLGVRVGIEICLDHSQGELSKNLREHESVDLHLIVSGGMSIQHGPVRTHKNGVCCLVDGFSKSQMNRNWFGRGVLKRDPLSWDAISNTTWQPYDVGPVFERSFLSSFDKHVWADTSSAKLQSSCESRTSPLKQALVLEGWSASLAGLFPTHVYKHAHELHKLIGFNSMSILQLCGPSIDMYWPITLGSNDDNGER